MLQNIRILVGPLPPETGNLREDYESLRAFLEELLRGLEINFDQLDRLVTEIKKGGAT